MTINPQALLLALVVALAACSAPEGGAPATQAQGATPPDQNAAFEALGHRYIDEFTRFVPIDASRIGDHRLDSELDDLSAASRQSRLDWTQVLLTELERIERSRLSRANQVDAAMLANRLRYDLWKLTTEKRWEWDPLLYNELAGSAIHNLMARDFAPLPDRLRSLTRRLEGLQRIYDQQRANLDVARVPKIYAEQAVARNPGVVELIDELVKPNLDAVSGADRDRLVEAINTATRAVMEHQKWLEARLLPNAKGDFRVGAAMFDAELAFHSRLDRAEIRRRAEADFHAVRQEMYEIARTALAGRARNIEMPDNPTRVQQQKVVQAALDLAAVERPTRDGLVDFAKGALERATDFVREKNLMTVPGDPVQVILMPKFQRGLYVAQCDAPGPLDAGQKTFYAISPIPDEWTKQQADSYLREYNDRALEVYTFHEAVPGHYLQLAAANRYPSKLRAVLWSPTFVEGWATYAMRLMTEAGWRDGDPLMKLTTIKLYKLRAIANAIIDQAIHAEGMTREDAMHLMMVGTFQEESEAAGKWQRAQLSATQLSTYYVGLQEQLDLRTEAQRKLGGKFNLKEYHDRVLSYGSPPAHLVRALMFDLPIEP